MNEETKWLKGTKELLEYAKAGQAVKKNNELFEIKELIDPDKQEQSPKEVKKPKKVKKDD